MSRSFAIALLAGLVAGCPSYDRDAAVRRQDGLVPPDVFARYGAEQAQAVAIGRALAAATTGTSLAEMSRTMTIVAEYARSMPDVVSVIPDAATRVVTVTFRSGWQKAITPIADGVPADRTPGAPKVP
jgi:hypothetical protein